MSEGKKGVLNATIDQQILEQLKKAQKQGDYTIPASQIVEKALKEYFKKKEAKK